MLCGYERLIRSLNVTVPQVGGDPYSLTSNCPLLPIMEHGCVCPSSYVIRGPWLLY